MHFKSFPLLVQVCNDVLYGDLSLTPHQQVQILSRGPVLKQPLKCPGLGFYELMLLYKFSQFSIHVIS